VLPQFRATGKAVQPGKGEGSSAALGKDKQKAVLKQRDQNIVVNEVRPASLPLLLADPVARDDERALSRRSTSS